VRSRAAGLTLLAIIPVALIGWLGYGWIQDFRNQEISIEEWVVRADQICQEAQEQSDANPAPESPLPGDKLRLTAKRTRDEVDDLRELDRPTEKKSAVAEYLISLEHRADELGNYADALDKTPAQGPLPDRTHLEELTNDSYTKGFALGLEKCNGGIDFSVDTTTTTLVPSSESTTPVPTAIGGQPEDEENTVDEPGSPE
jgi:hypothetical protein